MEDLFTGDIFSASLEKINETDVETTSRIANGPATVFNLPRIDLIFGIPSPNIYDYYVSGGFTSSSIIIKKDAIFCSTFWLVWAKFGIIGLLLYLSVYIKLVSKSRAIIPFIIMLFASMFFQGIAIGSSGFAFQMIFLYNFINNSNSSQNFSTIQ